jgi:hypothetical protein
MALDRPLASNALDSAKAAKQYSSFGSDIDLVLEKGVACRRIRILTTGGAAALALQMLDGTSVTFTNLVPGDVEDVQATKILASGTSNVTAVRVYW